MALNWDRLVKLQRDYPKPKFAEKEVLRQLKKKPLDPYLRVWKADIILQLGDITDEVKKLLDISSRLSPVTDSRLLAYHYKICLRAAKFENTDQLYRASAGEEALKAWQNAAKALQSKAERRALYSEIFACALREYCWEDVRWVAQKAGQESSLSKKKSAFVQILARQLAYEMACRVQGTPIDTKKNLDYQMAYIQTLQAFTNSAKKQTDIVQMQDMRDLRLMAQIFSRQRRTTELMEKWRGASTALAKVLWNHRFETVYTFMDSFYREKNWTRLENMCGSVVFDYNTPKACPEMLRSWKLWGRYMEAVMHLETLDGPSRDKRILEIRDKELGGMSFEGREIDLTRMALTTVLSKEMNLLELCKTYWNRNHHINASFHDLRRFVEALDRTQQEKFHAYISKASSDIRPSSNEHDRSLTAKWFRTELNVVKFDYLLTISRQDKPSEEAMNEFVKSAIKLYNIGASIEEENYQDAGILAIWTLLKLNRLFGAPPDRDGSASNDWFSVQASILALHLTAGAAGKQNRPLTLLSTRLHMNLGLATIAFEQYQLARVKEILNNTISYILLNNISRIHPFDSTGINKFYPDDELNKVTGSINRMESRVDDFLYTGLEDFQYDQAIELLEFKNQLRCSLTKHLCLIERRRIARLKCDPVDPTLYCGIEAFENLSDDRDRNVLPSFESTTYSDPLNFVALGQDELQSQNWMYRFLARLERCQRIVYQEPFALAAIDKQIDACNEHADREVTKPETDIEAYARDVMRAQKLISQIPQNPSLWNHLEKMFNVLRITIEAFHLWTNAMNRQLKTLEAKASQPEPLLSQLLPDMGLTKPVYEYMEFLQLVSRLCQNATDLLTKKNLKIPPVWKNKQNGPVQMLEQEVREAHRCLQSWARECITTLKTRGVKALLGQVQRGSTGEALKLVMTEEDQEFYVRRYVDSAIDTFEGYLKVKLK